MTEHEPRRTRRPRRHGHGLVLGKFYPPHAGHHHLVRTARQECDQLTVLVCAASVESLPLGLRVAWMQEAHPDCRVVGVVDDIPMDLGDPDIWEAHMAVFREGLRGGGVTGGVDAVFTSESYGPELARRFGAAHRSVDPDRAEHPVSGTAVRADPVAHWDALTPAVRAGLAWRVVVLGAESTGTTTLARELAAHYRGRGGVWETTRWVPEYGREYSEAKLAALRTRWPGSEWEDAEFVTEEFTVIAEEQDRREELAARDGSPVLVCDTDSFATTLWHERYLGRPNSEVMRIADRTRRQLYLLTRHEGVPFEDDGLRDGEELRPWMTQRFADELRRTGRPFTELRGNREERLAAAVSAVDALIAAGRGLADPLPDLTAHPLPERAAHPLPDRTPRLHSPPAPQRRTPSPWVASVAPGLAVAATSGEEPEESP